MKRIRARLVSGREQLFPDYVLDHYIKKKGITAFERSDGWVEIESGRIRQAAPSANYSGPRKRFRDHLAKKRVTDRIP